MTESIKLIFAILGISSAFLLFTLGMFINLSDRNKDVQGLAIGMGIVSFCTLLPSLIFILWYYRLLS